MLLPQSLAFVSLRNRLNAVNSAGFLHIAPKSSLPTLSTRSKIGRDEIKWQDLLLHFRTVQSKHEKARRQALGTDTMPFTGFSDSEKANEPPVGVGRAPGIRPPMRRKVTGEFAPTPTPAPPRSGVLSPLNPRARGQTGLLTSTNPTPATPAAGTQQNSRQRRGLSLAKS